MRFNPNFWAIGKPKVLDWLLGSTGVNSGSVLAYPGATVAFDFTRNYGQLNGSAYSVTAVPGWTFTRASTGYAETAAGALVAFASGAPRITDKGLLVEEARTNLLLRSQEFDNASWSKTNLTVTANATTAPDGTLTADKLEVTTTAATQALQTVTAFASTSGAMTIFGKIGSGATDANKFVFYNSTTATTLLSITINWTTGVITHVTGSGATSQQMADGWWRIIMPVTSGITSGDNVRMYAVGTGASETAGEFCYLWGAQLEAGAFPTSYIPTTTASATRALDVAALAFVAPSVGTLVVRASSYAINTNSNMAFAATDGGTTGRIGLYLYPSYTGFIVRNGGVNQADINAASGAANSTVYNWAGRYAANDFAACRSGGAVVTDVAGTVPSLTDLRFGGLAATQPLNGYVERAILYPTAFSDAALQAATA